MTMELTKYTRQQSLITTSFRYLSITIVLSAICTLLFVKWSDDPKLPMPLVAWSLAQWIPFSSIVQDLQGKAWRSHEQEIDMHRFVHPTPIPVIDFADPTIGDPLTYLENMYGTDWRERPLLLKGLWNASALQNPSRRLSSEGLRHENQTIPYFTDARVYGALTPDDHAPIHQIIEGILAGKPHKIASQLYLQANPSLLEEVAPLHILSKLFGDRFTSDRILGNIKNPMNLLRGPLTVPLFVANGKPVEESTCNVTPNTTTLHPFTGLHCEPIGNVAVQLAGAKEWTLIDPSYSHLLRPSVSPDSRGFFASWATSIQHVPRYEQIQTHAGDAIWVPTWTWHRVDYLESTVAMGASLFHFRPLDFARRNPLYAMLLLPYLMGEFFGIKSQ